MRIVPAIDVKQGKVVRAVAGHRSVYRPIESWLAESARVEDIGNGFAGKIGSTQAYVADLDAIEGAEPAWDLFVSLIECGLSLWIDAGLSDPSSAERMVEFAQDHPQINGVIGGLESMPDSATLQRCMEIAGPDRFIFSLDLKDGRPITGAADWQDMIAAEVAASVIGNGVTRLMLVDLARVGMHGGCGTHRLCRVLHVRFPEVAFYAGGGLRGPDDLETLYQSGCAAALVSSALHDGWITPEDVAQWNDG